MVAVIISFLLPIESKGLDLSETGHQMTKGKMHLVNETEEDNDYGALNVALHSKQSGNLRERF